MKKLFTLLTLLVAIVTGANADEAILSWYMGADGAAATGANSITGASGCAAEDFTIAITGNTGKNWSNGNGDITYNNTTYKTLKNSNGAQNTITCPSGKVATEVKFLVTTNDDSSGYLTEIDGTSCSEEVTSHKNYSEPTEITKDIDSKSSFTFTFSTKQVCFIAIVTYTDAPQDVVANPVISMTGNDVSITCDTQGASIYYTTNGTEPTTSSTIYSKAITLDNSCTIRAKAFNGANNQYSSDIVKHECYVTHPSALAVLGYNGGTVAGDVWTSNNGDFILTNNVEKRGINYADLAGSQDGFKLNHVDSYTLKVSEDIKVTKLVVVGKSWLKSENGNNASTIAFDDFTPASATFYDYPTDGETYVKTAEFTPSSELDYGASIIMRPGTNQLGAYIEVYGEKRNGPAAPEAVSSEPITWDFTDREAPSFEGNKSYSFTATDGTTEMRYSTGSSDAIVAKDGNTDGYLKENGKTGDGTVTDIDGETNVGKTRLIRLYVTGKGKLTINCGSNTGVYIVKDGSTSGTTLIDSYTANTQSSEITVSNFLWIETTTKGYINTIVWTPSSNDITLTTTENMDGWRAFYDANKSYTVDNNTKIYIVTAKDETKATLTEVTGRIPAQTPVLLKTSDANRTMTLTATDTGNEIDTKGNQLQVTDGNAVNGVYRLGYGDGGVGFYQYSATSPASGIVYLSSTGGAKALTFVFSDPTGISSVSAKKAVSTGKRFNLSGQLVGEDYKGIVIENGKKYIK